MDGLKELRVMDHSGENAGTCRSKLFANAGADVIELEAPQGDPHCTGVPQCPMATSLTPSISSPKSALTKTV
jgi:crotonobetainyl-CoA:carnitine CoA-transferase CaiB-like acyl-CoA transferase